MYVKTYSFPFLEAKNEGSSGVVDIAEQPIANFFVYVCVYVCVCVYIPPKGCYVDIPIYVEQKTVSLSGRRHHGMYECSTALHPPRVLIKFKHHQRAEGRIGTYCNSVSTFTLCNVTASQ